jgi:hypothetical protein
MLNWDFFTPSRYRTPPFCQKSLPYGKIWHGICNYLSKGVDFMVTTEVGFETVLHNISNLSNEQLLTLQVSIAQLLQNRIGEQPKDVPVAAMSREAATAETIQEMEEMFKDFLSPEEWSRVKKYIEKGERVLDDTPLPKSISEYVIEDRG